MEIKMVILDLDGTTLHTDKTISEYTKSVFTRCKEKGIKIAVATARAAWSATKYLEQIQPDILISHGGALAEEDGQVIYECRLSVETTDGIAKMMVDDPRCISLTMESAKGYSVERSKKYKTQYTHAIVRDFHEPVEEEAYKLTIELSDPAPAKAAAAKYPECTMLRFSGEDWYRFANKDAKKIDAIRAVAALKGWSLAEIAAFGDDINDLEMLRECGYGVAMKNGIDAVKAVAYDVTDTNDNDGVAKWLEAHVC